MSNKWETSKDAVPDGFTQITIYAEDTGERVATVFSEANARLIAAAPELLAACKMAIDWANDVPAPYREFPFIAAVRAAIAKAEAEGR